MTARDPGLVSRLVRGVIAPRIGRVLGEIALVMTTVPADPEPAAPTSTDPELGREKPELRLEDLERDWSLDVTLGATRRRLEVSLPVSIAELAENEELKRAVCGVLMQSARRLDECIGQAEPITPNRIRAREGLDRVEDPPTLDLDEVDARED